MLLFINFFIHMNLNHSFQLRVRYAETDQMGVVYHANYLNYFEVGRVEWLRNKGLPYKKLEEEGIGLPIVNINISYKKSAKYDDLLTIKTTLKSFEGVKVYFDCEIRNENDQLLTTAEFLLIFINLKTLKPCAPPHKIANILNSTSA